MTNQCPQCGATLPAGALGGLCPACLLKEGAAAETATQGSAPFDPPGVAELARLFPHLEILAFVGKGGMGAVYKARQPALDRIVALKILPPQTAADAGFAERFNREARALAKLNHPNIVAVHEFGQVNGQPFFLMEFVDGLNLRQLERAGKLSPREALQIVPQICEALQFAHDEGIVHRDIKPENILLDKKGRVKIADFGIAKIMGGDASDRSAGLRPGAAGNIGGNAPALTEAGRTIGTPNYMAPEQADRPQAVDHRADIYSLGVVFYEMLTGELPLGKFAPPSRRVLVDVRLDEVVLRALEKEPEHRYQHASEFKTQVETIAGGAPSDTPVVASAPRFSRTAIDGALCASLIPISAPFLAIIYDRSPWPDSTTQILMFLALILMLAATALGWLAVAQIRRSAGMLYGSSLAVVVGLLFPLLLLDYILVGASRSSRIGDFPGLLVALMLDALIVWGVWRKVNERPEGAPAVLPRQPSNPGGSAGSVEGSSPLAYAALFFAGLSGVLGFAALCQFPHPPEILVWSILASALAGVGLAIPARNSRLGHRALIGGCINAMIWLVIGMACQDRNRASQPLPSSDTTTDVFAVSFGPVMEHSLLFNSNGLTDFVDLESNRVVKFPIQGWKRPEGISFVEDSESNAIYINGIVHTLIMPAGDQAWDAVAAERSFESVVPDTSWRTMTMVKRRDLPATFLFRNSPGTFGALRLSGLAGSEDGVSIRYKFVMQSGTNAWLPAVEFWNPGPAGASKPIPREAVKLFNQNQDFMLRVLSHRRLQTSTANVEMARLVMQEQENGFRLRSLIQGTPLASVQLERIKASRQWEEMDPNRDPEKANKARAEMEIGQFNYERLMVEAGAADFIRPKANELQFGPWIEATVLHPSAGTNCCIDFDSGRLLTPPPEILAAMPSKPSPASAVSEARPEELGWFNISTPETETNAVSRWLAEAGVDAVELAPHRLIVCCPIAISSPIADPVLNPGQERQITPAWLLWKCYYMEKQQSAGPRQSNTVRVLSFPSDAVGASDNLCLFRTRAGNMGVLQVAGSTENPRGVKIRYKLVQGEGKNAGVPDFTEYSVNQTWAELGTNFDLSTPEKAVASFGMQVARGDDMAALLNRATIGPHAAPGSVPSDLSAAEIAGIPRSKIEEVVRYREDLAYVISRMSPTNNFFSTVVSLQDGEWKMYGDDNLKEFTRTKDEAVGQFKREAEKCRQEIRTFLGESRANSTTKPAVTNAEVLRIKLAAAEEKLKQVQAQVQTGIVPGSEADQAKFERDTLAAELKGDAVEVARLKLQFAELELQNAEKQKAVGIIPQGDYEKAKLARDLAAAELHQLQPTNK